MNNERQLGSRGVLSIAILLAIVAYFSLSSPSKAAVLDLGAAGQFTLLALGGSIDDSGPAGPQANPYTVNGPVGVVTSGQKFQASGDVVYSGPVYLHSGVTYNSSAAGVPQPTTGPAVDSLLEQAYTDAFNASAAALQLGMNPTATYGTISTTTTITENAVGNYVFNIAAINFSGGSTLTLDAPAGSTYLLNISTGITLTGGSILVSGGLTAADVLINYTGTNAAQFSGGGNTSQVYATILAPYAEVGLHPGLVVGSVIADSITMSSGADVIPVPEVTPSWLIFGFLGLVVAVTSRQGLMRRVRAFARLDGARAS